LVWLGEGADDDKGDIAMDSVSKQHWSEKEANAILALCKNNYQLRMWVIQEIVLAERITVLCDSKHVAWDAFKTLFDLKPSEYNDRLRASPAARLTGVKQQWRRKK